jgi:hypothetical protein
MHKKWNWNNFFNKNTTCLQIWVQTIIIGCMACLNFQKNIKCVFLRFIKIVTSDLHMWHNFLYITMDFRTKITTYVSNILIILPWSGVSFHIDKTNNLFFSSEFIFQSWNDNYDDFQHVNIIFSQNLIPLFGGLFNDKTNFRVRYSLHII